MTAHPPRGVELTLGSTSVSFGLPSYNEGAGIVATLSSLADSAAAAGLSRCDLFLSDSSVTTETVDAARAWAATRSDVQLVVDRSDVRRSQKEANNVILERACTDILVFTNADVLIPAQSLCALLQELLDPRVDIAVGVAGADPAFRGLRYRAARWQLRAVQRHARSMPKDALRGEGAFWGARRAFYENYRFPVGKGSLHDDVELMRHIAATGGNARNAAQAVVLKVPAGSFADFARQTARYYAATEGRQREGGEIRAGLIEALRDPVGAAIYFYWRLRLFVREHRGPTKFEEKWDVTESTKR